MNEKRESRFLRFYSRYAITSFTKKKITGHDTPSQTANLELAVSVRNPYKWTTKKLTESADSSILFTELRGSVMHPTQIPCTCCKIAPIRVHTRVSDEISVLLIITSINRGPRNHIVVLRDEKVQRCPILPKG